MELTSFYYLIREVWLGDQENLFTQTNQDPNISHTCENLEMFNVTSKYFSFFTKLHLQSMSRI